NEAPVPPPRWGARGVRAPLGAAGGFAGRGVGALLGHAWVCDVGPRHEWLRIAAAVARAVVGGQVVTVRAVVGEGVAAVEGPLFRLGTGERHLQAVRPDLVGELAGDVVSVVVPDRVAVLGERVGAALAVVLRVLACVRLLPVVGHVLVHDHVIVGVGLAVRARSLQIDGYVGNGRLVVLVRL